MRRETVGFPGAGDRAAAPVGNQPAHREGPTQSNSHTAHTQPVSFQAPESHWAAGARTTVI